MTYLPRVITTHAHVAPCNPCLPPATLRFIRQPLPSLEMTHQAAESSSTWS